MKMDDRMADSEMMGDIQSDAFEAGLRANQEYKEQLEYIENQVKLCLKQSNQEYNDAINRGDWSKVALEQRSITEYKTIMSIIKNSENPKRREYDREYQK